MSDIAEAWVLYQADLPDQKLVLPLWLLAKTCAHGGRDAWYPMDEFARLMRCDRRTAERRVKELERLGLIRRGDQTVVIAKYPNGQRPVVWDLPHVPSLGLPPDYLTSARNRAAVTRRPSTP